MTVSSSLRRRILRLATGRPFPPPDRLARAAIAFGASRWQARYPTSPSRLHARGSRVRSRFHSVFLLRQRVHGTVRPLRHHSRASDGPASNIDIELLRHGSGAATPGCATSRRRTSSTYVNSGRYANTFFHRATDFAATTRGRRVFLQGRRVHARRRRRPTATSPPTPPSTSSTPPTAPTRPGPSPSPGPAM